jgi:hypothetical protein
MLPIPDPCGRFGKLLSLATAAASAANSFTGDTVVHARDTNGKAILKPIKEIRIGDEVLAWDEAALVDGQLSQAKPIRLNTTKENTNTKTTRYEKVAGVITSELQQKLVHIKLDNGKTITATQGHPFRTEEGWRDAILLKRGGKLLLKGSEDSEDEAASTQQSRTVTIKDVQVEAKTIRVFNLEVNNLHAFFVGDDGVVVHNGFCTPKMRREWERLHGKPWPKNPMTEKIRPGGNQDGHHILPVARGGPPKDPKNITPMTPSQHTAWHKLNGYK